MFPLLNIISYLEILETNNNRVLKTSSNALSKPFLENFNEQPASIFDVLQLHTEKSIRNVRPILMEEQRQHTCLQLSHVEIKTIYKFKFKKFHRCKRNRHQRETSLNRLVEHAIVANFPMDQCETIEYSSFDRKLISFDSF
ncbi:hypothetical protein T02_14013 [Trichinella nativa]|uniref:Uncharacterized protein n=1 Tax=Trichinella nativa TaxID=6335 RepID=A0A0V1KL93_9BILA|nr:hypothetical protein T02_14013 [Trichinella nativa]